MLLQDCIRSIAPLDEPAMAAARQRQDTLTKPPGSLGRLEELSIQLAGIAGRCPPPVPTRKAVIVFAGDHDRGPVHSLFGAGVGRAWDRDQPRGS